MDKSPTIFIPNIYKTSHQETTKKLSVGSEEQQSLPKHILTYVDSCIERAIKPHFETFENEDIKPNLLSLIHELQDKVDSCVKKTGDIVSGSLHILKMPQAEMDATNKHYVDWLYSSLNEDIKNKHSKNCDLDLNHFRLKNIQSPKELNDAASKNYVDEKFQNLMGLYNPTHHIFSKGQTMSNKKTFFFNPGFICPHDIHITSVGFSTSPIKYNLREKQKFGEVNPTKLYFMIDQEIKSEHVIEKDIKLGYILKEFENPVVFEKGVNFMMVIETPIEDSSVNVVFY